MPNILNIHQQDNLIKNCTSNKHKAIILFLLDSGLFPFELIQLQCQHISFLEILENEKESAIH